MVIFRIDSDAMKKANLTQFILLFFCIEARSLCLILDFCRAALISYLLHPDDKLVLASLCVLVALLQNEGKMSL